MTSLMHRSGSLEDAENVDGTRARSSIITKASAIRIAVASILTITAVVGVLINSDKKDSSPATNSVAPSSAKPMPAPTAAPAPVAPSQSPKSFATDALGFVGTAARCAPPQSAVATGRTEKSLVVICKGRDGRLEYKGVRLSLGAGVTVGDVTANADGFFARNDAVTYAVTPTELVIRSADAIVARERMVEFRGPQAVRPPPAAPAPTARQAAPPVAPRPAAAPMPAPQAQQPQAPAQSTNPAMPDYPPLPVTMRGTGDGIVRFTAAKPWQLHYLVQCPAGATLRGSINAGASYMRYHVELHGGPRAEGTSPSRDQAGPIVVSIALVDQRCGWELTAS